MSENVIEQKTAARVLTGSHLVNGNFAVAEGALYAGAQGFFGYPITPSSSIMERLAQRLPTLDPPGAFLQCEDEIASITACIGGSWTGNKTLTATSGPGFSLMQEGIGLAAFTETPLVLANVMRGGPSTGLPTYPGHQDMMQAHFGSHGDYLIPTIVPGSVQECFDMTVEAFNISEALRTPVFVFTDQILSKLVEVMEIPPADKLEVVTRACPESEPVVLKGETIDPKLVPPMNCFGGKTITFSTGLSHSPDGYPKLDSDTFVGLVDRQKEKIMRYQHLFPQPIEFLVEDADILVVAIGTVARSARRAIKVARKEGLKVGLFRPTTFWPFPADQLRRAAEGKSRIIVAELSVGQLVWPVERYLWREVELLAHYTGKLLPPRDILAKIRSSR